MASTVAQAAKPSTRPEGASRVRYRIDKMDCPTEERLIRNKLEPMPGIARLDFNLLDRELTVYHRLDDPHSIAAVLESFDMAPQALEAGVSRRGIPLAPQVRGKGRQENLRDHDCSRPCDGHLSDRQ